MQSNEKKISIPFDDKSRSQSPNESTYKAHLLKLEKLGYEMKKKENHLISKANLITNKVAYLSNLYIEVNKISILMKEVWTAIKAQSYGK